MIDIVNDNIQEFSLNYNLNLKESCQYIKQTLLKWSLNKKNYLLSGDNTIKLTLTSTNRERSRRKKRSPISCILLPRRRTLRRSLNVRKRPFLLEKAGISNLQILLTKITDSKIHHRNTWNSRWERARRGSRARTEIMCVNR